MKCTILLISVLIFEVHSEIQHGIRQVRQINNKKEDFEKNFNLEKELGGYNKGDEKGPKYEHENGETKPEVNFREYDDDSSDRGRTGRKGCRDPEDCKDNKDRKGENGRGPPRDDDDRGGDGGGRRDPGDKEGGRGGPEDKEGGRKGPGKEEGGPKMSGKSLKKNGKKGFYKSGGSSQYAFLNNNNVHFFLGLFILMYLTKF